MTQGNQQQQGQQEEQQQQPSSEQQLGKALTDIRKVQNMMEMHYPDQGNAIHMLREAGDLVWSEVKRVQQQQSQQ
jgi:hypothetical protein